MKASRFRWWIVGLWILAALGCNPDPGSGPQQSGGPPSIVLITIDGLVGEDLSVFGGPVQTPNLSRLAGAGIAWSDVWTVCPLTRPAVATLLTGLTPDRHGVVDDLLSRLPDATPTLAGVLGREGFRTAAFPDTSVLGPSSGLLHEFELIDDPPALSIGPISWLPEIKAPGEVATDFTAYLKTLSIGDRFFAWIHLSGPLNSQVLLEMGHTSMLDSIPEGGDRPRTEDAVERVDRGVGQVLDALQATGRLEGSAVFVVGTGGDARGGGDELPGPGFSLNERAVRVPLIARLSGGTKGPDQSRPVWSPDLAVTLAGLGGANLEGSEGIDLFHDAPIDRVLFSWSGAPRDQLGWRALRAARSGGVKRIEGFISRTIPLDRDHGAVEPAEEQRLVRAMADRAGVPLPPSVPTDSVRGLIEARGVRVEALPADGRAFGTPQGRIEVLGHLWNARQAIRQQRADTAGARYRDVIELDPQNLAGLLGLGQIGAMMGSADSKALMARALGLYPDHPEVIHWYAHAIWGESWEDAEPLIIAVQPHMPNQADVLYDLACARSLAGDLKASEKFLRDSIEAGYRQWDHIETDSDLRNLRESRRLAAVMREYGR